MAALLPASPVPWPAAEIEAALRPSLPGLVLESVAQIDSTNAELMRRAHLGRFEPVLLVADHQSAGRGRLGRSWLSAAAQTGSPPPSLTFSLGLPLAMADWSGLSLAVGVAVALSLHADIRLKWPNDLWVAQAKLGGILIETTPMPEAAQDQARAAQPYASGPFRFAVLGLGLNIALPEASGLSTPPAALRTLLPALDAPQALARVAAPLVQAVQRFAAQGFAPFASAFAARDALAGCAVRLSDGTEGQAMGVDASGALRLRTASGMQRVDSGEISVRPHDAQNTPARPA